MKVNVGNDVLIRVSEPSVVNGGSLIGTVTEVTESTITVAGETFTFAELAVVEVVPSLA